MQEKCTVVARGEEVMVRGWLYALSKMHSFEVVVWSGEEEVVWSRDDCQRRSCHRCELEEMLEDGSFVGLVGGL